MNFKHVLLILAALFVWGITNIIYLYFFMYLFSTFLNAFMFLIFGVPQVSGGSGGVEI